MCIRMHVCAKGAPVATDMRRVGVGKAQRLMNVKTLNATGDQHGTESIPGTHCVYDTGLLRTLTFCFTVAGCVKAGVSSVASRDDQSL